MFSGGPGPPPLAPVCARVDSLSSRPGPAGYRSARGPGSFRAPPPARGRDPRRRGRAAEERAPSELAPSPSFGPEPFTGRGVVKAAVANCQRPPTRGPGGGGPFETSPAAAVAPGAVRPARRPASATGPGYGGARQYISPWPARSPRAAPSGRRCPRPVPAPVVLGAESGARSASKPTSPPGTPASGLTGADG